MALAYEDRVKDQTTTTGTGTVTIDGIAPTGYRTITSSYASGDTLRYTIINSTGSQWEVGQGVWTTSGSTLTRATVYASSNAGALVNFSAGAKTVFTGVTAQDLMDVPLPNSTAATISMDGTQAAGSSALYARADHVHPSDTSRSPLAGSTSLTTTGTVTTGTWSANIANAKLTTARETITVSATAATGTITYDALTQSVLYYTTSATANFTVNVRGNSGTSLNTMMAVGDALTVAFFVTNGATAYYQTGFQIDGVTVTPKWQGGTAPVSGNASSIDAYTYVIVKTASATYTVFASQIKFA